MSNLNGNLSGKGALVDTNNDGIVDGFAHTIKNAGNFSTFSLTNGILSLAPTSGGSSIGGANTQVQFNDAGSLSGESTFVYNKTTNTLTVSNLTVSDTLTVTTTTTLNSNTVTIGDAIIVLNSDATGSASANAGIEIERGDDTNVQLLWDETNDQWDFDGFALGSVGKVYGAGSGAIYTFTSDTDTGIEHTGTDQLGLLVGGGRVLMVNSNGVNIAPAGATGAGSNQALLVDDIVIDTQTISTSGSNKNVIIAPHGSGSIELGGVSSNATAVTTTASAHNVVGTSVTISSGSTTAGTTNNIAGGNLTLASGQGKGTGAGGSILFKTADGGSSGSVLNSLTTKMTILDSGFVGIAQNTPTVPLHVGGNVIISGNLTVSGTSTTVSTTNTFVTDAVLTLNSGESGNGVTGGVGGFEVDRGENSGVDNPLARFVFDESDDKWKVQLETGSGSGSYAAAGLVASSIEGTTGTFSGDLTVDTNVLKVDTANNRVGINKTPTDALDVNGNALVSGTSTLSGLVTANGGILAGDVGYMVSFLNNNASNTATGMPLRVDGSHASAVTQANQAQSNSIANCAVGLAVSATANGATGQMILAGGLASVAAAQFTGSDPADGDAVYVSGTVGKLTVDVPSSGFVQQVARIIDTNVSVSGNSGTAHIMVSIGTPIAADVYDDDDVLTTEQVQDIVGAMFTGNTETNIAVTYQDGDGTIDLVSTDTNTQLTTEEVQDIVGAMFSSNTETRISATYEDGDGTIDLVVDDMTANTQLTTEEVQDIVGGMVTGNTETGITVTYQDGDGTLDFSVSGGSGGTIGIANGEYLGANANVADNDFLRVDGTLVEGRTAAQTLTDIAAMPLAGGAFTGDVSIGGTGTFTAPRALVEAPAVSGNPLSATIVELVRPQAGFILLADANSTTVGLPDPGTNQIGDTYVIINTTGGNVTIERSGLAASGGHGVACTLNGATANGTLPANEAVTLVCTGSSGGGLGDIWHGIGL